MPVGISISSTSNLATGQKIAVANAIKAFEPAAPDIHLVENISIPQGHKQWDVLVWARFASADALTEGVDLSVSQQLVTNTVTITPSEYGIIATISKRLRRRQGDADVVSSIGEMLGSSLARRFSIRIITLYDGFSASAPGANQPLDISYFSSGVAALRTDNSSSYGPAPFPVHAALHPEQIRDLVDRIADTRPGGLPTSMTEELLRNYWRGRDNVYGVQIWESGNITRDSSGDSKGGIFASKALRIVMAGNAEPTKEPDESARLQEFGIFQEEGDGEIADVWGLEVYSDTTAAWTFT